MHTKNYVDFLLSLHPPNNIFIMYDMDDNDHQISVAFTSFLCSGGFASIYVDECEKYILKVDLEIREEERTERGVRDEAIFYNHIRQKLLQNKQMGMNKLNVPTILWNGQLSCGREAMILRKTGTSLDAIFDAHEGMWSYSTFNFVASRILEQIMSLHELGIVHGDIKPDNFAFYENKFYLFDFGLCSFYRNVDSGEHISYHESQNTIVGTLRYASLFNHCGICYSRRDDLESFVYMMMYFFFHQVPWQTTEICEDVRTIKESCIENMLLKMGPIWTCFYKSVRNLHFQETLNCLDWIILFDSEASRTPSTIEKDLLPREEKNESFQKRSRLKTQKHKKMI